MKKIFLSTLVSSLLLVSALDADSNKNLTSKEVSAKATQAATKKAENDKVKLIDEAINSLKLATKALKELENKKIDDAKKDIKLALGELEAILAADTVPKLLPIENRIVVKNFIGSAKDVETAIKEVKSLLSKNRVQEAGELLISLQSEIDMTVISLPLITYPDALKLASKYIIENKPEKAKEVLKLALSTFTEVEHVIPIPLVNSVQLVSIASKIAKEDKEQALKYLASASDELDKAEKLGYISSSTTTYKQLHKMINNIEKEIKGPNKAEKLFEELGEKLKEFKDKIFSSNEKNSSK
jgi:ribosomal protein S20